LSFIVSFKLRSPGGLRISRLNRGNLVVYNAYGTVQSL
jgi:hypothetical protein